MATRKRLTLDLDHEFQKRLKIAAAIKGVSMREYCERAIGKELEKDEPKEPEYRRDLSASR